MKWFQKISIGQMKWATLVIGSFMVSGWTLIRFMIKNTNFDLVGQQELAHQWLQGYHSGAHIGPTNYILKMLLLYMPTDVLKISPRWELIGITLLINVITFITLVWVLEQMWLVFYKRIPRTFYLAMLWLAAMSGSMYWIQFSNSRNIEIVFGLITLLVLIRLQKRESPKGYAAAFIFGTLAMFTDPLQLYMTIIPGLVYACARIMLGAKISRRGVLHCLRLVGIVAVSFVTAKALMYLVVSIYHPEFLTVANQASGQGVAHILIAGGQGVVKQTARLYVGGFELGRYVEAVNLLFVAGVAAIGVFCAFRNKVSRSAIALIATVFVIDGSVYLLSGQSLQAGTARYMIMTVPFFALLLAMVIHAKTRLKPIIVVATVAILIVNMLSIGAVLVRNWDTSFNQDNHIISVIRYLQGHRYAYGYASMDSAIPGDFLSGNQVGIIPLSCEIDGQAHPSILFFDTAYISQLQSRTGDVVPIVFDGDSISNTPNVCPASAVIALLGQPVGTDHTSDGSIVLLYRPQALQQWRTH